MGSPKLLVNLKTLPSELKQVIHDVAIITGKQAVDLFKENFQKESFNGKPWQEVARRKNPKTGVVSRGINKGKSRESNAAASRKILTGETGDLGESIQYKYLGNAQVSIFSDKTYAQAHNEGTTTAGRGNKTTIPRRQFMGQSPELDIIVKNEIEKKLKNLFK